MATELDAAELMLLRAAWMENNHLDYEKESAMAKMDAIEVTDGQDAAIGQLTKLRYGFQDFHNQRPSYLV